MIEYLKEFGFPIFVVLWFMFRTEKVIGQNTRAINDLKQIILKNLNNG